MDTMHLVDPELRALVDQYAGSMVDAQTLGALRQGMTEAAPVDDGAGDGLAVKVERRSVPRLNGQGSVPVVLVRPDAEKSNHGGILHLHGGGMVMGSPDPWLPLLRQMVSQLDCVIVSVDYPLAPEAVFPAAIEDCYSALCWMAGEAGSLGVDPARVGVAGESAGGGLAAALALLARDRGGPSLAFQNLLYPMLDDRTGSIGDSNPATGQFMWKREDNRFGWASLLGEAPGGSDVSLYAAPARATDFSALPPAYIAVGSLDLFLDEDAAYAMRLIRAGVSVELNVYPGAVHGFDFAADAAVSKRATQQRMDAFSRALLPPIKVSDTKVSDTPATDLEAIYRRYVASLNERRLGELSEFVHDPIRFNGNIVSLAEYAKAISSNIDAVPDYHWELQDLITNGNALAVRITDTGTPQEEWLGIAPSGQFMTTQEFAFYRFREGKIAEMWFLLDVQAIKSQLEGMTQ